MTSNVASVTFIPRVLQFVADYFISKLIQCKQILPKKLNITERTIDKQENLYNKIQCPELIDVRKKERKKTRWNLLH